MPLSPPPRNASTPMWFNGYNGKDLRRESAVLIPLDSLFFFLEEYLNLVNEHARVAKSVVLPRVDAILECSSYARHH